MYHRSRFGQLDAREGRERLGPKSRCIATADIAVVVPDALQDDLGLTANRAGLGAAELLDVRGVPDAQVHRVPAARVGAAEGKALTEVGLGAAMQGQGQSHPSPRLAGAGAFVQSPV